MTKADNLTVEIPGSLLHVVGEPNNRNNMDNTEAARTYDTFAEQAEGIALLFKGDKLEAAWRLLDSLHEDTARLLMRDEGNAARCRRYRVRRKAAQAAQA